MSRVLENARNQIIRKFNPLTHRGVDILKEKNKVANILAHSDGVVTEVVLDTKEESKKTYGNCVKIKHKNGYSTLYAHLDKIFVKEKDFVYQGDQIGSMGTSGNSRHTHLHFEMLNKLGKRKNPTKYLDNDLP